MSLLLKCNELAMNLPMKLFCTNQILRNALELQILDIIQAQGLSEGRVDLTSLFSLNLTEMEAIREHVEGINIEGVGTRGARKFRFYTYKYLNSESFTMDNNACRLMQLPSKQVDKSLNIFPNVIDLFCSLMICGNVCHLFIIRAN